MGLAEVTVTVGETGLLDWLTLAFVGFGALATAALAYIAFTEIRALRRTLSGERFIASELIAVLDAVSTAPETATTREPGSGAAVSELVRVEVGRHDPVFDRLVFEVSGRDPPGFEVEYRDEAALEDVGISGDAAVAVRLFPCRAHDQFGAATAVLRTRAWFPVVREATQVSDAGDTVEWMIGLSGTHHYLAYQLSDPPRVVVDLYRAR